MVVDSIAAVFRGEFTPSEMAARSDTIFSFGRQLKALADRFHLAVVCINQVRRVEGGAWSVERGGCEWLGWSVWRVEIVCGRCCHPLYLIHRSLLLA